MAEHLASIFGTEKDRVNCPFYFKIGYVNLRVRLIGMIVVLVQYSNDVSDMSS